MLTGNSGVGANSLNNLLVISKFEYTYPSISKSEKNVAPETNTFEPLSKVSTASPTTSPFSIGVLSPCLSASLP